MICSLKNEENEKKISGLENQVENLKKDLKEKDLQIMEINDRLQDIDQKEKLNNIIINGLELKTFSMAAGQNSRDATNEISISPSNREIMSEKFSIWTKENLCVDVKPEDIKQIIPLKNKQGIYSNSKIIFNKYEKKKEVLIGKRNLFQKKVTNIFVNEDLTQKNFKLLMEARKLKKERKIENVWTSDCTVMVKTWSTVRQKGQIIAIRKIQDLEKI